MNLNKPIKLRQIRDFSRNISITFDFLRENFKSLYKSLLMIAGGIMIISYTVGFGIISLVEPFYNTSETPERDELEPLINPIFGGVTDVFFVSNSLLVPLVFFLSTLVVIAVTYRYLLLYPKHGKQISPAFLWSFVKKDLWKIFLGTVLFFFLGFLGAIVTTAVTAAMGWFVAFILICLLIYAVIPLSLIHIIILVENVGPIDAIKRSLFLIRGKWLNTFGVIFITSLIIYAISMAVYLPATVVGTFISFNSLDAPSSFDENAGYFSVLVIAITLIYSMSFFLSLPITYLALAFQYFSIVEEKEHIGLIKRIETIGEGHEKW